MADENLPTLGIAVETGGAVVNLDALAVAGDKADASLGGVATAAKTASAALGNTGGIESARRSLLAMGVPAEKVEQALQANAAAFAKVGEAAAAAAPQIAATERAAQSAAAGLVATNTAANGSTVGLGRLGQSLTTFVGHIAGANPVIDRLGYSLSSFALGGPATVAVLGGLAAVGVAYEVLTEKTRAAQKQIDTAADAIRKLHDSSIGGPIKLEVEIEGALTKIGQLQTRITQLRQVASGTGFLGGFARGAAGFVGGALGGTLGGTLGEQLAVAGVERVAGYFGDRTQATQDATRTGVYDARQQATQQYITGLAELAAQGKATRGEIAAVTAEIARQQQLFRDTSRNLGALSTTGSGESAALTEIANTALTRATDLQAKLNTFAEQQQAAADKAAREADRASRERARTAKEAYDAIVRAAEGNLSNRREARADGLGQLSRIGTASDTTDPLLLGQQSAFYQAQQRALTGLDPAKLKATFSKSLDFLGDKDQLAKLAHAQELGANFGAVLGDALTSGVGAGFDALFSSGSLTAGLGAFAGTLLSGFGGAIQSFGEASLAASQLMATITTAISSLDPIAGAAASVALIGLGAGLKAAASHMFSGARGGGSSGSSGGGFYGSASGGLPNIIDRGVIAGAIGAPSIPSAAAFGGGRLGTPVTPVTVAATIIGPSDPKAQSDITQLIRNAVERGLTAPGFAPATA